ncbi:hypothetical protein HDU98_006035, partial [Podochytrium sp. JEL0797]
MRMNEMIPAAFWCLWTLSPTAYARPLPRIQKRQQLVNYGGMLIPSVAVSPIYYGSVPLASELDKFYTFLVNSSIMDVL